MSAGLGGVQGSYYGKRKRMNQSIINAYLLLIESKQGETKLIDEFVSSGIETEAKTKIASELNKNKRQIKNPVSRRIFIRGGTVLGNSWKL